MNEFPELTVYESASVGRCSVEGGDDSNYVHAEIEAASFETAKQWAHLFKAAPKMLETLEDAVKWYGLDGDGISDPTLSKLQAAISAARGIDDN